MTRINISYLLAIGLLGTAVASPAPRPMAVPQSQQEIDPNPSLTYSSRDPTVTDFQTQNTTASPTTSASSSADSPAATASPSLTQIAAFTAPNGGKYTATAIDGTLRIAGYQLTAGGGDALVGGVRVSAASDGLAYGDNTAPYKKVTGVSTSQVVSTSTDAAGSTQVVSSSATVAVTEATGSSSASGSAAASSGSASASAASTGGAAAGVTARGAVAALGGIAVLVCVFA